MTKGPLEAEGDIASNILAKDEAESDLTPGFRMRRRALIYLPVLTAAALVFNPGNLLGQKTASVERPKSDETIKGLEKSVAVDLDWEEFIKQGVPGLQELYNSAQEARGQDAYLFSLAHWAARLRMETIPRAKLFRFGALNPPVHFGVGYKGVPFIVVEWRLEPGAYLPPHNHPNYGVCTLGLEGEARISNFQIIGNAPAFSSKDTFQVRETHSELMSAGRINSLSPTRDNIHTFQAGKAGARGIDFGTLYGKDIGFSFLNIEEKPMDTEGRIFDATWRKLE